MPDRIQLIVHNGAELAALLQACRDSRASVFAVREQAQALLFEIDPQQACALYRQWRQQLPVQGDHGGGILQHWLSAAQTRSDASSSSDANSSTDAGSVPASAAAGPLIQSFRGQDCRAMRFVQQDLRGADFSDADLRGVDFSGANLQGALFQRAQLGLPDDRGWFAQGVKSCFKLFGSWNWHYMQRNLTNLGTRFRACDVSGADFSGASIGVVNFHGANLARCNWRGAHWLGPLWGSDTRLHQPALMALLCQGSRQQLDFSHQDLSRLDLSWLDLSGFDLRHSVVNDAIVSHARLSGTDIRSLRRNAATRWEQIDCDHWRWPDLEGGRWPPLPDSLASGDAARWLTVLEPGVVFLAYSAAELQSWLDVVAQMGLRLQQIRFAEAAATDSTQAWFQIAVQAGAHDCARLCKQAWQRKMALAKPVPEPQLLALFAPLLPDLPDQTNISA